MEHSTKPGMIDVAAESAASAIRVLTTATLNLGQAKGESGLARTKSYQLGLAGAYLAMTSLRTTLFTQAGLPNEGLFANGNEQALRAFINKITGFKEAPDA